MSFYCPPPTTLLDSFLYKVIIGEIIKLAKRLGRQSCPSRRLQLATGVCAILFISHRHIVARPIIYPLAKYFFTTCLLAWITLWCRCFWHGCIVGTYYFFPIWGLAASSRCPIDSRFCLRLGTLSRATGWGVNTLFSQ